MRVLIDECIDEQLRYEFASHECQTARYAGLAGLKNGRLLNSAEAAGFDVIVTIDQSIPHQQNLAGRRISILVLRAPTNRLRDLLPTIVPALRALETIAPGEVLTVSRD